ncbi:MULTISPECIES: hypothetical protein [Gordonia]|uniref:Uncharacterized protein n=1 Tax=Gordonia amicalis TaxID=89053 RepID=A0ABU4D928_9ACTN|nr:MULTISPECIES: hypothetical protein [Gordonia]MCZ4581809.1 hypothetical protein [Gordonia amicalis]MCZ4651127.1 hypothetical protein [Gordonia amicalis]MDJ0452143.1 hypothetical protein [Gordonia amicalis]MDV6305762.1 hypothetical protein [Gordonia amicalis]MDV7074756.1 hypothetical protein [Gordonia amicalis]
MTAEEYLAAQDATVEEAAAAYARIKSSGAPAARAEFWRLVDVFWTRQAKWGHRVGLG